MNLNPNTHLLIDQEIELKTLKLENSEELFQLVEKNRTYLREFFGWLDHNTSEKDTITFISKQHQLLARNESLMLGIRYHGELVGTVALEKIDQLNHSASIGYWIDKAHQGKGIITRSVEKLIDYARRSLRLHRIQILCATGNKKSQKVTESLGFAREGTLKDAIWHYGQYFDAYLYALILNEAADSSRE